MIVLVEVRGRVYWIHHHRQFQFILPEGAEVWTALEMAGFALTGRERLQLNGRPTQPNQRLADGDRLVIIADPEDQDVDQPNGTMGEE